MVIQPGTVAYWRELFGSSDKFVFLLGTFLDHAQCEQVAYFTISSQRKWMAVPATRREMLVIPVGTVNYLAVESYIQCWRELLITPAAQFHDLERRGFINYRGELPQFVEPVKKIVADSDMLSEEHIEMALAALA